MNRELLERVLRNASDISRTIIFAQLDLSRLSPNESRLTIQRIGHFIETLLYSILYDDGFLKVYYTYDDVQSLDNPLRQKVEEFNDSLRALREDAVQLQAVVRLGVREGRYKDYSRSGADDIQIIASWLAATNSFSRTLESLLFIRAEAISIVDAWEAFQVPNPSEPNTHSLVFRFDSRPLTLQESVAWMTFLDALIYSASAITGESSQEIRVERFEFGSVVQILKNVPLPVLQFMIDFFKRGVGNDPIKDGIRLGAGIEFIRGLPKLSDEEKEAICSRMKEAYGILGRTRVDTIEIDGKDIGDIQLPAYSFWRDNE